MATHFGIDHATFQVEPESHQEHEPGDVAPLRRLSSRAHDGGPPIRHDHRMTTAPAERVVDALIGAHLVDPSSRAESLSVVAGALDGQAQPSGTGRRALPQLVEVVAYLGGALVLAAGALFLFEQWGELGFGARVAWLAVSTVVLLVAGFVAAQVPADGPGLREPANDVRRRLAGSLLTFAGLGRRDPRRPRGRPRR